MNRLAAGRTPSRSHPRRRDGVIRAISVAALTAVMTVAPLSGAASALAQAPIRPIATAATQPTAAASAVSDVAATRAAAAPTSIRRAPPESALVPPAPGSGPAVTPAAPGPCDDDINFGERVSCTFPTSTTIRELDFPATAGDQILIHVIVTGGSVNPLTTITKSGTDVCQGGFSDEFVCTIVSSGTHTVEMDAAGTGTGTAVLTTQRLNDPVGCAAIAYGTDGKTGSISATAEIDCYTHVATAGQRWFVHVVETSGTATLLQEVVRPDGTVMCGFTGASDLQCLLDQSGPFRVLVQDSGGLATGNYRVVIEKFPGATGCTAAQLGKRVGLEVTKPGALSCVTFSGSTGDQVRIRDVVASGSWNPLTDVLRADGSTVCQGGFSDEFTCALTSGGQHTIVLRDGTGTGAATGSVGVYVQILNDPTGCISLPYGPIGKTGKINPAAEIDCFTQTAQAGDRLRVHVVETGGTATLLQEVVRPDGTTVCGATGATDNTCLVDQTGPARVLIQDSSGLATGDYRVVIERFPNPTGCTAATFGKRVTVKVDKPGAAACITFTGKAGDSIRVRDVVTTGSWNPLTDVVRPDGSVVCQGGFSDEYNCQLTTNGKHTLVLADGTGTGAGTGNADVVVQNLTDPVGCPTITSGTDGKAGSITPAVEMDCFTFDGKAGDRWLVRAVEVSGTTALVQEVIGPDGSVICGLTGATDQVCLLTSNGPTLVMVQDSSGLNTGDYRVVVERFPGPKGCDSTSIGGPVVNGSVDLAGAIGCATFGASAGHSFHVKVTAGGAFNPLTNVLRTDGSIVCQGGFSDDFICTPTTNGKHTVYVADGAGTGADTGAYTIELDAA